MSEAPGPHGRPHPPFPIHYNVWFSFKPGSDEREALDRVFEFLDELQQQQRIHNFTLLRNRAASADSRLARFHALITFVDDEQFSSPFQEIAARGVHAGKHGVMIEQIDNFIVETFEVIDRPA